MNQTKKKRIEIDKDDVCNLIYYTSFKTFVTDVHYLLIGLKELSLKESYIQKLSNMTF